MVATAEPARYILQRLSGRPFTTGIRPLSNLILVASANPQKTDIASAMMAIVLISTLVVSFFFMFGIISVYHVQ